MLKLEHLTLNDRAYTTIKQGLISGKFAPGEVLVIRKLAEMYGISTTPIREALQRLVAERVLEIAPNRSIFVPLLTASTFEELTSIRVAMEGVAGERATRHMTDSALVEVKALYNSMGRAVAARNGSLYLALNEAFHFAIYTQANAPLLLNMVRDLWVRVGPYLSLLMESAAYVPRSNDVHQKIVEALERRDSAAVRASIEEDITSAAAVLGERLEEVVSASKSANVG